jgi:signal transduction histidine kinase
MTKSSHAIEVPQSRVVEAVPADWLDRLLTLAVALPISSGEAALVEAMVEGLAAILPSYAVGICHVPEPGPRRRDQLVVKSLPEGMLEPPAGIDPTRIFPGLAYEHVAALAGSTTGSTLHVASDEHPLDRASPAVQVVDRAAAAFGRTLANARSIRELAEAQRDESALDQRMAQVDKLATFGQIAAGMVHELNNPLTSIVAYSDYLIRRALAREASQDADDVERLRRISESANRMLRFTRDLVAYARPSASTAIPIVLHAVIDQAVAFCEHVLSTAGVRVQRAYGLDVLAVRGVSEQLVQVFVNLLTNAGQAARESGGCVTLATSLAPDGGVVICVQDDGAGIAAEHLPRVFDPFFTTKADRQGTGLGLSIVRRIVEGHGGTIRVESEPGRGARFVIELPPV